MTSAENALTPQQRGPARLVRAQERTGEETAACQVLLLLGLRSDLENCDARNSLHLCEGPERNVQIIRSSGCQIDNDLVANRTANQLLGVG
jgi:hypothetical protein